MLLILGLRDLNESISPDSALQLLGQALFLSQNIKKSGINLDGRHGRGFCHQ